MFGVVTPKKEMKKSSIDGTRFEILKAFFCYRRVPSAAEEYNCGDLLIHEKEMKCATRLPRLIDYEIKQNRLG